MRDIYRAQPGPVPAVLPGRDQQQPARRGLRGLRPGLHGARRPPTTWRSRRDGRVMEVLSRAQLPRLAGGLHPHRTARHVRHLRGVRDGQRLADRPARQVAGGGGATCPGGPRCPSLNVLLTSTAWRNDHNGFSHQGPGLIQVVLTQRGDVGPGLPAAGRQLPAVGGRPLPAVALVRQPDRHRQAAAAAVADHGRGDRALRPRRRASGSGPAPTTAPADPDIVLACAGDVVTMETVAAAADPARAAARSCRSAWSTSST